MASDPDGASAPLVDLSVGVSTLTPAAGVSGHRIPVAVRRVVTAAMPRCVAPGCSVPAARCDLDHRVPWPVGPACACDLAPLCRTHHRTKTLRGWTVRAGHPVEPRADDAEPAVAPSGRGDGTLTWTSPLGAVFETRPGRRWPVVATDPVAAARSSERHRARAGARVAGARTARSAPPAPTWLTDPGALPPS